MEYVKEDQGKQSILSKRYLDVYFMTHREDDHDFLLHDKNMILFVESSFIYLSIYLIYLIYLYLSLSICLSVCMSIYLSAWTRGVGKVSKV